MLAKQDELDFGGCTNVGACHEVCPKGIPLATISQLNHDVLGATLTGARSD
jgi:succinate dehydrogenase / fumarate reductase iron-sulfur subunit